MLAEGRHPTSTLPVPAPPTVPDRAALLAVGASPAMVDNPHEAAQLAAVAAHAHVAVAARAATAACAGPGSFAITWLDALDDAGPEAVAAADVRAGG